MITKLTDLVDVIHRRQTERWNEGSGPMEEMWLPAIAYDQVASDATAMCCFPGFIVVDEMLCLGVKIMRMDDA